MEASPGVQRGNPQPVAWGRAQNAGGGGAPWRKDHATVKVSQRKSTEGVCNCFVFFSVYFLRLEK